MFPDTGGLLNGKYVSSRSAGNYLAGFNAAKATTILGHYTNFETFQKLAGTLHLYGKKGLLLRAPRILLSGKSYGEPPAYGELQYQYRQSKAGWNEGMLYRAISL